jgi:hypothetical protein
MELPFLKKRQREANEIPLFNINISAKGSINFDDTTNSIIAENIINRYMELRQILRRTVKVLSDGKIIPGKEDGLHTYEADMDVEDFILDPHIHYNNSGMIETIETFKGEIYLKSIREYHRDYQTFEGSRFGKKLKPHYTLNGFYQARKIKSIDERIKALEAFFIDKESQQPEHQRIQIGSIAKEYTRLHLLENNYRRTISNQ